VVDIINIDIYINDISNNLSSKAQTWDFQATFHEKYRNDQQVSYHVVVTDLDPQILCTK